jgi:hypothetical protein
MKLLDFIERITRDPCIGMGLINSIAHDKAMAGTPAWKTTVLWFVPAWCYSSYSWVMGHTICKHFDHDWVDESYGGPDSGCMAGHCNRCGYSFHHTLY